MIKEQKLQFIDILASALSSKNIYLVDISNLKAHQTSELRKTCYTAQVKVMMVKNTLLSIAMKKYKKKMAPFFSVIKGNTLIMFSSVENEPAKIIFDYKKKNKSEIPLLKMAYVADIFYIGNDKLKYLVNIQSKEELIGGIILALQSSLINVVTTLQVPSNKIIEYLQKKC